MGCRFLKFVFVGIGMFSALLVSTARTEAAVLVPGGAGYIGSHTVHQLLSRGEKVVVLDNLSTGQRWSVPHGVTFIEGDVGDLELLRRVIQEYQIEAIIDFAAYISVSESVIFPEKYMENNYVNCKNLARISDELGVKYFIFSSTCAVYGDPETNPVTESEAIKPKSPYGESKRLAELALQGPDQVVTKMKSVILRYFNVAGARMEGGTGQCTPGVSSLVRTICRVACGEEEYLPVYGSQYPTPDGTAIRDFIHVDDLAEAHIDALNYLRNGGESDLFNVGYGEGTSVQTMVDIGNDLCDGTLPIRKVGIREGDIVEIFSDPSKIKGQLGWAPRLYSPEKGARASMKTIIRSALDWEKLRVQKSAVNSQLKS